GEEEERGRSLELPVERELHRQRLRRRRARQQHRAERRRAARPPSSHRSPSSAFRPAIPAKPAPRMTHAWENFHSSVVIPAKAGTPAGGSGGPRLSAGCAGGGFTPPRAPRAPPAPSAVNFFYRPPPQAAARFSAAKPQLASLSSQAAT